LANYDPYELTKFFVFETFWKNFGFDFMTRQLTVPFKTNLILFCPILIELAGLKVEKTAVHVQTWHEEYMVFQLQLFIVYTSTVLRAAVSSSFANFARSDELLVLTSPRLDYCNAAFAGLPQTTLRPLQRMQLPVSLPT
jgi:hypothetical protein